jgi:hypothetical protein
MNRCARLLLLLVAVAAPIRAQGMAYIPSDTPDTGVANGFPFGDYFGPTWRYQVRLDARHLPRAPVRVVGVAFAANRSPTGSFSAPEFQLRMAHVSRTSLDATFASNFESPPIILHEGAMRYVPADGAWSDLDLQGSFGYDGVRSLVLEIRYRGRTSGCTYLQAVNSIPRVWANSDTGAPDPYSATTGRATASFGLKTRLTWVTDHVMLAPDTVSPGSMAVIRMLSAPAGAAYWIAASLGQSGIDVPPYRLHLTPDGVFLASIGTGLPLFQGYSGTVAHDGSAVARLLTPPLPALIGVTVYHAGVSIRAGQIVGATNTAGTLIQ